MSKTQEAPKDEQRDSLDARGLTCLCGCGQDTIRDVARFLPGHDASLRKAVIRGRMSRKAIPEIALPFFEADPDPIAGLELKGDWVRDVKAKPTTKLSGDELQKLADAAKAREAKEATK